LEALQPMLRLLSAQVRHSEQQHLHPLVLAVVSASVRRPLQ
jgi:hypothetical protein